MEKNRKYGHFLALPNCYCAISYQTKGTIHFHVINFCMLFIGLRQQQKLKKELETPLLCGVFSAHFVFQTIAGKCY